MSQVTIITGSPSKQSRSAALSEYIAAYLQDEKYEVKTVHVRDLPAEDLVYANFSSPAIQEAQKKVADADAVIIMTDWDEIKHIDFARLKRLMHYPIIVDARNIINPEILKQLGFACDTIGQSYLCKKRNEYVRTLVPIHMHKQVPSNRFVAIKD